MRRVLVLVVLPLILCGRALLGGGLFLPQLPVGYEPLASERPAAASAAWEAANYLASDRIFPVLTDELAIQRALARGALPLWDDAAGLGLPLLGGTLAGALYPPNWIAYATDPVRAAPWLAALALFLAGLGAWLFLERRELGFGACAIGALALQAGGFACANLHDRMKLDAALWLPWMLWAIEGLALGRRRARFALAGATALGFLAGFPPIAIFQAAAALAYAGWRRWGDGVRALPLARTVLLIACGVGIAAPQLLATLDASRASTRGPRTVADLRAESLPLATGLTLVAPALFGSPQEPVFAPHEPVAWWLTPRGAAAAAQNANPLEWSLFAGCAVVALAAAGVAGAWRAARAFALLALVALGFAQGWPGIAWLYALPGLDLGAPARAACVLWVALPILAAFGAQALCERRPRALGAALATAGACALLGLAAYARVEPERWAAELETTLAARHDVPAAEVRALIPVETAVAAGRRVALEGERLFVAALGALATALFAAGAARRGRARIAWVPLALVVLAEGALAALPHVALRPAQAEGVFPPSPAMRALAEAAGGGRVLRFDPSASGVADVLALARPDLPEAYGIRDLTPYVAFPARNLVELVEAIDPAARYRTGISRLSSPALLGHRVLDLLDVTAVLSREPLEHPRLTAVYERDGFHVYRRANLVAPARVVAAAMETRSDDDALALLRQQLVDPARAAVLAPGESFDAPYPPGAPGEVAVERNGPGALAVEVRGTAGGLLVLSEGWAPGWRARVDGVAAPVLRVDHALRAVAIPAGARVRVEFEYRPTWLVGGSLIACIAIAVTFFAAGKKGGTSP